VSDGCLRPQTWADQRLTTRSPLSEYDCIVFNGRKDQYHCQLRFDHHDQTADCSLHNCRYASEDLAVADSEL